MDERTPSEKKGQAMDDNTVSPNEDINSGTQSASSKKENTSLEPKEVASADGCLDSMLNTIYKVSVYILVAFAILWNWDGLWQANILPVKSVLRKTFPGKYVREQLKIDSQKKNIPLFVEMCSQISSLEIEAAEVRKLWQYYDASFRMIRFLKDKLTGEQLDDSFKYSDKYTIGIWEEKPESLPETFTFGDE